jgi:predicted ATP-grasp superfamily ATP-dependent carboligase
MSPEGSVFLFELATCSSKAMPPEIMIEGMGMFKALLEGFENPFSFYNSEDYVELFKESLEKAEYALAIAPESEMMLYNFSKLIEKSGCKNLGSNSKGVRMSSDKLLTHNLIKELGPKTRIYSGNTKMEFPLISKPRDGVSCENVKLIRSEGELENVPKGHLIQEYVPGVPMSASLIVGEEIKIISINTQEIVDFNYTGARMPINLPNQENIVEAVQSVPGLCGYVGVDFIYSNEEPIIIEINPRPTTPIIGLNRAFGVNVSSMIIDNYNGKTISQPKINGLFAIRKTNSSKGYVSYNNHSLEIREIHEPIVT